MDVLGSAAFSSLIPASPRANIDWIGRLYWSLTRFILADHAAFDDTALMFDLERPPTSDFKPGRYHLISKSQPNVPGEFLYRLSHPLGEWVIATGKTCPTPVTRVTFDVSNYSVKLSMIEAIKGQSGWLALQHLAIDSFDKEEYLLFSAFTDSGKSLDQETCERLFHCSATVEPLDGLPDNAKTRLIVETNLHADAAVACSLEDNNRLFSEDSGTSGEVVRGYGGCCGEGVGCYEGSDQGRPPTVSLGDHAG